MKIRPNFMQMTTPVALITETEIPDSIVVTGVLEQPKDLV